MKTYIIIPAHNEAEFIGKTLQSLIDQTVTPDRIVVVDDHSTDETFQISNSFAEKYDFISAIRTISSKKHLPGSKVVQAFYKGYETLEGDFNIICKFDADLIFPENYLEKITAHFSSDPSIGMAGGFCTIRDQDGWKLENLTAKNHIRGALKAYRKECFEQIGMLKPAMGWDTADELLAQYHGWNVKTDSELLVKHLKPTGRTYNDSSKFKQGEAFYRLHYGLIITLIASAKLAYLKKNPRLFRDYLYGYFKARREKQPFLVSTSEGQYIRKLRFRNMLKKLF